jgi:hypothetical protein
MAYKGLTTFTMTYKELAKKELVFLHLLFLTETPSYVRLIIC